MAPSTSPASPQPEGEAERYALPALRRFYAFHAPIYDWSRPLILRGRRQLVLGLGAGRGHKVLDVGCGTGLNLVLLARSGAAAIGIECTPAMLRRAETRLARQPAAVRERLCLDPRPYGTHSDYEGRADRVLFSYSLSMIPPYAEVLDRARSDLRPGGRIGVVDFLDAAAVLGRSLERSHVCLGPARLETLRRLFPKHRLRVRSTGLWRYFTFLGELD
jgi:S-adenosylmethionine-diacylgycerolhomoserine-N-methlytransferase